MMNWLATLQRRLRSQEHGGTAVRVTVAEVRGSAPRDAGACMLICSDGADGTIGGGHLELMATRIAHEMLRAPWPVPQRLDRFPLGATLGQCCGGIVELWFERYSGDDLAFVQTALHAQRTGAPAFMTTSLAATPCTRHRLVDAAEAMALFTGLRSEARAILTRGAEGDAVLYERIDSDALPLWLFGAGHVGKALVKILENLPFDITWVDNREAIFPAPLADNVRVLQSDEPADEVHHAPAGALFLVLTHNHDLDFAICRAILARRDFAWAGLIGSATKAARFTQKLRSRGYAAADVARITTPIGVKGIASKLPAAIAVAVAAQVMQIAEAMQHAEHSSAVSTGLTP